MGAVTLTNAGNDVTTLAATVTGAGNAFAYTDANALTIGTVDGINGVSTNNGAISVATTNGALTVSNTPAAPDVNAGTSTVALTAGGVNQLLTVTGTVTGTGGVTYTADNMSLTGATNAGAAIATLQPNTAGQLVNLGGADAAGTLGLTDAELDTVTAGTLRVGSATSGNMTISAALTPAGTTTLSLLSGGSVTENVGATITTTNLAVTSVGAVTLNQANDVTTLAATVTGAGNAFAYTDANALTIGTVDGINGVSTNNGAISVATTNGALTVSNTPAAPDVNAGTSTVALTAGGVNQLLTVTGTVTGTGGVTYTADNMSLTGATNAGAAIATLQPNTAGQLVNLGGADAAGTLGLTDAELDTVTAGTLRVGRNNSGNLTISAAIDTANTTTTTLISGGTVTQTAPITETNLAVNAVGAVTLTNAGNDVTTLAATVTGAGNAFAYTDANALTIGTVDGINGVSTNNGAISVATTNGALTVSNTPAAPDVNAGTSTVALTAGGVNQLLTVTGTVTGTGGVTYTADNMSLTGATNAGAAIATLQPNTAGQLVNLGGADAAGTLGLTDAELDTVTAGTLRVGSATSGNMTISAALTPAGTTTLSLLSGGSVTENVGATITTTNLAVTSVGAVTLNQANDVTTLAATVTGAGNAFAYTDANALTIGTVDGINGVSTNNGAISVATTNGALTVSNTPAAPDVNAGTSTVAFTAGGVNQLLTVPAPSPVRVVSRTRPIT